MRPTLVVPKLKSYVNSKSVITLQRPSIVSDVTPEDAKQIWDEFRTSNKTVYNCLRGQINAMADQLGQRINITFSNKQPGMLDVTIAPKAAATTREAADEFVAIFRDFPNAQKHYANLKKMFATAEKIEKNGDVITHTVDPRTNFLGQIRESIYELAEKAKLRSIQ